VRNKARDLFLPGDRRLHDRRQHPRWRYIGCGPLQRAQAQAYVLAGNLGVQAMIPLRALKGTPCRGKNAA
jgi:hypothetical protein